MKSFPLVTFGICRTIPVLEFAELDEFTDDEEDSQGHGYDSDNSQFVIDVLIWNLVHHVLETFSEMVIDRSESLAKVQEDNNDIDEVEKELHSEAKVEIILFKL